jgi:hypothetical protein
MSGLKSGIARLAKRVIESIEDAFKLLFNAKIYEIIMKNDHDDYGIANLTNFKQINVDELEKFLGSLILTGAYRAKNEPKRNLWSKEDGRPVFNSIFSRDRFFKYYDAFDLTNPLKEISIIWTS